MPSMSLKHKLKLFSNYILAGRFREIYNIFWVYTFWWNRKLSTYLLNSLFPKIGIDLFPPFLEVEHTTICPFRCKICVPKDEIILSDMPKLIQNITSEDSVFSKKGKLQKVLGTKQREYEGELIRINAEGMLPLSVTPEHRVLVSRREWIGRPRKQRKYAYSEKLEFIEAKNLNRDYSLVFPKLQEVGEYSEKIPLSEDLMKFLGIYLAEGCVCTSSRKSKGKVIGNHGIVSLYFGKHELELIQETCELIQKVFNKKAFVIEKETAFNVIFHSVEIARWLSQFGTQATQKRIPKFIMFLKDNQLIRAFIDGFIEGDGYVNPKYVQLTTSSRVLALQLQKLLSRLDIFGRIYENKRAGTSFICGRKVNIHNLYNVKITTPDFYKFLDKENISKRKLRHYERTADYFFLPIRKISRIAYSGTVHNLETEDETFELHNAVIHNCEHSYWKEPSINMPFEKFKKVYNQFGNLKWIGLTGIGSSYMNPDFHKIVAYCKSKGTIVELMDHFSTFRDENQIRELLEIGPDFQFASMYGATKKTSESICIGSDFDKVIKNIRTFVRLKKEMKKRFPILNFHFIITQKSKPELLGFLDFLHSLDTEIGEILVTPMLHDFKEAKGYSVKLDKKYIDAAEEKARKYGLAMTINMCAQQDARELAKKPPMTLCKEYIMPFIFVTGDVTPCCGQNEANQRDWQKKMSFGNVFREDFRKIWYSPRYKKMREMIRKNKCPQECALCPAFEKN